MAANPKSDLVFDFPDPTPRFEFGDGPAKQGGGPSPSSSSKNKKGKRFIGKFGRSSKGNGSKGKGNANSDNSPSKQSLGSSSGTATTHTTSHLNSSLDASLDGSDYSSHLGDGYFVRSDASPLKLKSRNSSADIAAGPQRASGDYNKPAHFDMAPSQHQKSSPKHVAPKNPRHSPGGGGGQSSSRNSSPGRSRPPSPGERRPHHNNHNRHSRDPSSASTSGYISEVSEFSFDRVTVTTNETGHTNQSSNVSWGFVDDAVLDAVGAVGGGQKGGGTPVGGGNKDRFVPYTGDAMNDSGRTKKVGNGKDGDRGHRTSASAGTFSNVSLSSDEDGDNIPFTGIVPDGAQSVVSEISERTGLEGSPGYGGNTDAVKALLREGMESARQKHAAENAANPSTPEGRSGKKSKAGLSKIREGGSDGGSPSRHTRSTAGSTASGGNDGRAATGSFLEDLKRTYAKYKTDRNGVRRDGDERPPSMLHSIAEDVQFCGLYFCGLDAARRAGDGDKSTMGDDERDDEAMRRRRQERKREADDTFLGRVIQCGNAYGCGDGSAFCVAL